MNSRTALVALVSLLAGARSGAGQQGAQPPGRYDNQLRPELMLVHATAPGVEASLGGQMQIGQHAGLSQARVGGQLQWFAAPKVVLGAGFQYFRSHTPSGTAVTERRPQGFATLRVPLSPHLGLQDRNLLELRDRGGVRSYRYRNRLTLERRSRLAGRDLRLYAYEEPYYDSRYSAWVRNQVAVGATAAAGRRMVAEVYLMRQDDHHARPGDLMVLGTVLRVRV